MKITGPASQKLFNQTGCLTDENTARSVKIRMVSTGEEGSAEDARSLNSQKGFVSADSKGLNIKCDRIDQRPWVMTLSEKKRADVQKRKDQYTQFVQHEQQRVSLQHELVASYVPQSEMKAYIEHNPQGLAPLPAQHVPEVEEVRNEIVRTSQKCTSTFYFQGLDRIDWTMTKLSWL